MGFASGLVTNCQRRLAAAKLQFELHYWSRGPKDVGFASGFVTNCQRRLAAGKLQFPDTAVWESLLTLPDVHFVLQSGSRFGILAENASAALAGWQEGSGMK